MIGDWGKGWEIQVQPVAVQSKPKRMHDAGRRCENEEPLYLLRAETGDCSHSSAAYYFRLGCREAEESPHSLTASI